MNLAKQLFIWAWQRGVATPQQRAHGPRVEARVASEVLHVRARRELDTRHRGRRRRCPAPSVTDAAFAAHATVRAEQGGEGAHGVARDELVVRGEEQQVLADAAARQVRLRFVPGLPGLRMFTIRMLALRQAFRFVPGLPHVSS